MPAKYIPRRGDIIWTDIDQATGQVSQPAMVLSQEPFNQQIQLALVAPIANCVRGHGFEVVLEGGEIQGAVLCQQVRTIDYESRGVKFAEKAPDEITLDVLAKVRVLVS